MDSNELREQLPKGKRRRPADEFSITSIQIDGGPILPVAGEVRVKDPVTGGEKGSKPEDFACVPPWPQMEVARVYGYGAKKYAQHNWRRGYAWSLSVSAAMRHWMRFVQGESVDPESGFHHLAHVVFHCNTLMEFERLGLGTDDLLRDPR